jgi:hypothetical protein
MIYLAPYVMVLMRAYPLGGQVGGGWALEIETFLGPGIAMSEAGAILGPKKTPRRECRKLPEKAEGCVSFQQIDNSPVLI